MGRPKKLVSQENIKKFQQELEMAGDNAAMLLRDKKGRSRSCLLCRRRKQRCDRKQPSCSNCLKAKVKCVQPARYNPSNLMDGTSPSPLPSFDEATPKYFRPNVAPTRLPNEQYTQYLEDRVHALERMLNKSKTPMQLPIPNGNENALASGSNVFPSGDNGRARLFKNASPFPSGAPTQMESSSLPALASDSLESVDFSKCIFANYNLKEFMNYDPVFEFDGMLSRSFLDTFFTRLQFKYPLLDEQEIYDFHAHYISNDIHSYSETGFHFACGRMWLVFSISACLYMTTGKYKGLPPVRYFSTAVRHIARCGQSLNNVQRVELLTLLVLYMLRTDRDSSVLYEIIKDVVFICKEKLHLNNMQPNDPYANEKLRIFWCVYLLERMICVAVGRPYTISEKEINLPLFSEESFNNASNKHADKSTNGRGVHFINQSLKLRRIESQFVEHLQILPLKHNKKEVLRSQLPMVKKFFQDLEVWRAGCSKDDIKNFENETLKLYYYRSVRLLLQPYLEFMRPEDKLFRECQAAAGQICQLYKIFHQKTLTGHSTPAIHTVFIAGVTLIYCMWLARNNDDERRKKLGDESKHTRPLVSASLFSTMDDLRACSVCLYVMTERSNFARTFRDTFDQLMNATVGNLIERCGPDSSELIYLSSQKDKSMDHLEDQPTKDKATNDSESGMPPATDRTFGKRQAQEHEGFVEISQVDIEEQKEFKRRQGVLEKMSVPKSLSHLLIKVEDDKEEESVNQDKKDQRSEGSRDKYIVKKPTNSTEFDWKSFQQQALVQQHIARENLKAYLSSLNYLNGTKSVAFNPGAHIYSPPEMQPPNLSINNRASTENAPLQVRPINTDEKAGMNRPQNVAPQTAAARTRIISHITSGPTTGSNSPSSMPNMGLLYNNGTHDMINDISTWTNDSVMQLMDNESLATTNFYSQENFSFLPHEEERFLPQIKHATSPQQSSDTNGSQPALSTNANGKGFHSTAIDAIQVRTDFDKLRRHPSATGHNSMVEKFWTVNDDYGFLT
ncbi:hypothetical protein HG536_0H04070 [Torulaspora globosa]|uniref:Zn(2)-C6 fungal-type domain-containing protein n=1 Tax=Torulaspora globosa TaxID=48254 RepID=A0A7G3ZNE5_9SACH|nr:uncharacterized protein HG536_0H04070 [Torulaspora globosa]QLL35031.1 hypothetical protein HG536_0H04070 [Torulaspora globosa]